MTESTTKEAPSGAKAWKKGDAHFLSGRFDEAAECYEAAAARLDDPRIQIRLGKCQQELGRRDLARQAFMRAYEIAPNLAAAALMLGYLEYDEGDLKQSALWFDKVIETESHNSAAQRMRALIGYRKGACRQALLEWAANPSWNVDTLVRMIVAMEQDRLADTGAATALYEEDPADGATAITERSMSRLMRKCRSALERKDLATATLAADAMLKHHPDNPASHYALAYVAFEKGQFAEAERSFSRSLYMQKKIDLRHGLPRCRKATLRRVRACRARLSDDPSLLSMKALALIRMRRTAEARKILIDIPLIGPDGFNKFYNLGLCALVDGMPDDGARLFRYSLEHYTVDTLEICVAELMDWARKKYEVPMKTSHPDII